MYKVGRSEVDVFTFPEHIHTYCRECPKHNSIRSANLSIYSIYLEEKKKEGSKHAVMCQRCRSFSVRSKQYRRIVSRRVVLIRFDHTAVSLNGAEESGGKEEEWVQARSTCK